MNPEIKEPLHDYELLRLLGDGSNGVVYLAKDLKAGTLCAVKEFALGQLSAQRFFRELSFLFTFKHPNIIRCQNLIYGGEKKSYLILEFAEHGNLRQAITQAGGLLPSEEVLILARHISAALAEAHAQDIIHCDVKPENILLSGNPERVTYKLADLGISLHRKRDQQVSSSGSPQYMAPEQFYDLPVPASDLYSLGVTLYECLTGFRLYEATDSQELFAAHTQQPADLEMVKCPHWRHTLSRLLAKDPSQRPTSPAEINHLWDLIEFQKEALIPKPIAYEPGLSSADYGRELCSTTIFKSSIAAPGATLLFAPAPDRLAEIWLADGKFIDSYHIHEARLKVQAWVGNLHCGSKKQDTWLCLDKNLCLWQPENRRMQVVGSVRTNTLALESCGEFIATATSSAVSLYSARGVLLHEVACANYVLEPHLLWIDEILYATSGPAQPALLKISKEGTILEKISLPAPVLGLFQNPKTQKLSLVTQGADAEQVCKLLSLEEDLSLQLVAELPPALYRCNNHGDFLTLFDLQGLVHLILPDGTLHDEIQTEGQPLSDAWIPVANSYSLLCREGHNNRLSMFDLKSQPSRTPISQPQTQQP